MAGLQCLSRQRYAPTSTDSLFRSIKSYRRILCTPSSFAFCAVGSAGYTVHHQRGRRLLLIGCSSVGDSSMNVKDCAARRKSPLATPRCLRAEATREMSGALNALVADVFALYVNFFFQAEDGIRDIGVTGVQTCALPI